MSLQVPLCWDSFPDLFFKVLGDFEEFWQVIFFQCDWSNVCYSIARKGKAESLVDHCYPLISKLRILSWAWSNWAVICSDYEITLSSAFLQFSLEGNLNWHSEAWHACFMSLRAQHTHTLFKIFLHEEFVYSIPFAHLFNYLYQYRNADVNFIFCVKGNLIVLNEMGPSTALGSSYSWCMSYFDMPLMHCACVCCGLSEMTTYFRLTLDSFWPSSRTFLLFKELQWPRSSSYCVLCC